LTPATGADFGTAQRATATPLFTTPQANDHWLQLKHVFESG
jgi:hypothetical protein